MLAPGPFCSSSASVRSARSGSPRFGRRHLASAAALGQQRRERARQAAAPVLAAVVGPPPALDLLRMLWLSSRRARHDRHAVTLQHAPARRAPASTAAAAKERHASPPGQRHLLCRCSCSSGVAASRRGPPQRARWQPRRAYRSAPPAPQAAHNAPALHATPPICHCVGLACLPLRATRADGACVFPRPGVARCAATRQGVALLRREAAGAHATRCSLLFCQVPSPGEQPARRSASCTCARHEATAIRSAARLPARQRGPPQRLCHAHATTYVREGQ